jgi:ABC-type lipoprotein export system ATPase subunit/glycosyltransferase involved in cell wall biosynthesis
MYCGSCMRDNALATALRRQGHEVTLIPLFSPLRTDSGRDASVPDVYYGGVNVYLQHVTPIFRHTPRLLDAIFDRPWLLGAASRIGAQTPPEKLGSLTMDVLEGEDGNATKELSRLVGFLREHVKPQVVSLPNLMFVGLARTFARELNVPVVCELTGEDIFLDAMREEDRRQIQRAICARTGDVARFVATSEYYAGRMAEYLDVPRGRIDVIYPGLSDEYLSQQPPPPRPVDRPLTVGYLARICGEKGLGRLVEAFILLKRLPGMSEARLKVGGYLGGRDRQWFAELRRRVEAEGLSSSVDFLGEVDLAGKLALLNSIDVFSVPTAYPEPKGIYVLEALSCGVPVVQPAHGSFPELIRITEGGVLVPPGDARALAGTLAGLLGDPQRRAELGLRGRQSVRADFTDERMASNVYDVFSEVTSKTEAPMTRDNGNGTAPHHAAADSLVVKDVWKEYPTPGEPLLVLRGVSISLSPGQTLAIVGPSGSGKSTLLNILGTLDTPTRGSVRLGESDPFSFKAADLARFRSRRIGFVFQDHHLLPQCSALENVLVAKLAEGKVSDADAARARELLKMVGLENRAGHLPSELSGGERQRVAIARALMNAPDLLLCDEPTGNLDQKNSHAVTQLLLDLAAKSGAILVTVTHSAQVAAMFDRQLHMTDGVLAEAPGEQPEVRQGMAGAAAR